MRLLNPTDVAHVIDQHIVEGHAVVELAESPDVTAAIEAGVLQRLDDDAPPAARVALPPKSTPKEA